MANTEQTTRCPRCGRAIWAARSLRNGYGPTCSRRVRQAARENALAGLNPTQRDKALELIESGGIVAVRPRRIFRSVSSDGTRRYLTTVTGWCTCPSGMNHKTCYHVGAARAAAV